MLLRERLSEKKVMLIETEQLEEEQSTERQRLWTEDTQKQGMAVIRQKANNNRKKATTHNMNKQDRSSTKESIGGEWVQWQDWEMRVVKGKG